MRTLMEIYSKCDKEDIPIVGNWMKKFKAIIAKGYYSNYRIMANFNDKFYLVITNKRINTDILTVLPYLEQALRKYYRKCDVYIENNKIVIDNQGS